MGFQSRFDSPSVCYSLELAGNAMGTPLPKDELGYWFSFLNRIALFSFRSSLSEGGPFRCLFGAYLHMYFTFTVAV
ncbi:unnamed protein product [Arctogadus glacialis]